MDIAPHPPSKKRIAARFNRAAGTYISSAKVQAEIARCVAELVESEIGGGQIWCDLGSGGGTLSEHLRGASVSSSAWIICLDLACAPLRRSLDTKRAALAVNADIDSLPFPPSSLDGAIAASSLQWSASPLEALRGIAQSLKAGAPLCFGAFVEGAFAELAEVRARMGLLPSVVWLPTVGELLMALDDAGFDVSEDSIACYESVQRFQDAAGAIGSLSRIGVTATGGKLLNRQELNTLYKDYTHMFGKDDGAVPITYRAVIGKAKKKSNS